jgi:hypothetical protein
MSKINVLLERGFKLHFQLASGPFYFANVSLDVHDT